MALLRKPSHCSQQECFFPPLDSMVLWSLPLFCLCLPLHVYFLPFYQLNHELLEIAFGLPQDSNILGAQ